VAIETRKAKLVPFKGSRDAIGAEVLEGPQAGIVYVLDESSTSVAKRNALMGREVVVAYAPADQFARLATRREAIRPELGALAVEHLGEKFAILEERGSDSLDFHDASVLGVRRMLEAAYLLGADSARAALAARVVDAFGLDDLSNFTPEQRRVIVAAREVLS